MCRSEKYDFVRIGTESDIAAHERSHLGTTAFASMDETDAARSQVTISEPSADTDEQGNPGLNLMPIGKPLYSDVAYNQRKLFSLAHAQASGFVDDRAVALGSAKGVPQQVRGIQDVIEQPHLPQVHIARQMKSEKTVLQFFRDQLDKLDLAFHGEPNVFFFELRPRY